MTPFEWNSADWLSASFCVGGPVFLIGVALLSRWYWPARINAFDEFAKLVADSNSAVTGRIWEVIEDRIVTRGDWKCDGSELKYRLVLSTTLENGAPLEFVEELLQSVEPCYGEALEPRKKILREEAQAKARLFTEQLPSMSCKDVEVAYLCPMEEDFTG